MKINKLTSTICGLILVAGCGEVVSESEAVKPVVKSVVAASTAEATLTLETEMQKVSYAIGTQLGAQLKRDDLNLDLSIFTQAITDALAGKEPMMAPADMMATMQAFQKKKQAELQSKREGQATANKETGDAFLVENGKKDGVVTTESGLQYKIMTAGTGAKPSKDDTVEVHYRGTLLSGEEFDSSYKRGQPASFPVTRVIPGWTEALQMMPEGSKWQLYVPSKLAYGPGGPDKIGPNSTLIFDVELLKAKVEKPEVKAPSAVKVEAK